MGHKMNQRYDSDLRMSGYNMGLFGNDDPAEIVIPVIPPERKEVTIPEQDIIVNVGTEEEPEYQQLAIEPGEEILRRSIEEGYDPFASYAPYESDASKFLKNIALPAGIAAVVFALIGN